MIGSVLNFRALNVKVFCLLKSSGRVFGWGDLDGFAIQGRAAALVLQSKASGTRFTTSSGLFNLINTVKKLAAIQKLLNFP